MVKAHVLEEQLSASIKQVGGFGSLKDGPAPRRDSPFGPQYVREGNEPGALPGQRTAPTAPEVKTDVTPSPAPVSEPPPHPNPPLTPLSPRSALASPKSHLPARTRSITKPAADAALDSEAFGMEKVTVLMSPAVRDAVQMLARKLQRRRTQKQSRITANTVFRAAIRLLVEELPLRGSEVANTEEELLDLLRARLGEGQ